MEARHTTAGRGLVARQGEVFVVEGDGDLVSGIGDQLGIRFDLDRNDLAAVTSRIAETVDANAILVLFTMFDDRGAAGPAYFVPFYNDVEGTGMGPIDQRLDFGVSRFVAVVNLKRRGSHGDRIARNAVHEIAHRHLAYLPPIATGTSSFDVLGRQGSHWHALLHSEGSLLGGHDLRQIGPSRFVVVDSNVRLSSLDLYLLGLTGPGDVSPFFFISFGATEQGRPIPEAAELLPGEVIVGERIDLVGDDVLRAAGVRSAGDPMTRLVFALVTHPGEVRTSTSVIEEAAAIDRLRADLARAWSDHTRGLGQMCTTADECPLSSDGGVDDRGEPDDRESCGCRMVNREEGAGRGATEPWLSLAPALLLALIRCPGRGRSCDRCFQRGSPRRRGALRPSS